MEVSVKNEPAFDYICSFGPQKRKADDTEAIDEPSVQAHFDRDNIDTIEAMKPDSGVKKKHKCDICNKFFPSLASLNGHKGSHRRQTCQICAKKFLNAIRLAIHIQNKHYDTQMSYHTKENQMKDKDEPEKSIVEPTEGKSIAEIANTMRTTKENDKKAFTQLQNGAMVELIHDNENTIGNRQGDELISKINGKNPVMYLYELCQARRWPPPKFETIPSRNQFQFQMRVLVDHVYYQSSAFSYSKKDAKTVAALCALKALLSV